jgi:hypothetical protein
MIDNMNINICIGILFLGFLIKMINLYRNFYKVCKNLDTDERIKFFNNKYIVAIISKFGIVKNFFIFFILIPIIKFNYFILSIFISLIHSLCEMEYDDFMEKNGFSFSDFSHDEIEKILNNNDDDVFTNNDNNLIINNMDINLIRNDEKNKILEEKELLIDKKIEFYMKNKNNLEKLDINLIDNLDVNLIDNYTKLESLILNNDLNFDFNTNLNIEELKKDMNFINEGIEVLKIDDIDFGDNLNTFFNNFNNKDNKIKVNNSENIVVIKAGKKKINK